MSRDKYITSLNHLGNAFLAVPALLEFASCLSVRYRCGMSEVILIVNRRWCTPYLELVNIFIAINVV